MQRVVIIGAGPTGLGAGHRLRELGHDHFVILEACDGVGGLARSFTDAAGFTYDIGGHVLFSHYPYYDGLVDQLMGDRSSEIVREAWVWIEGRHIPYPFQNNLRALRPETVYECVSGLIEAQRRDSDPRNVADPGSAKPDPGASLSSRRRGRLRRPENFRSWMQAVFGAGITRHFMLPYNEKVWATPPELMDHGWIAERVSVVDVDTVLRNVLLGEDQRGWGPNSTFRYPLHGGTGYLFERLGEEVADHLELSCPVVAIDPAERVVTTADGRRWPYDALLSTMPLDELVGVTAGVPDAVAEAAGQLHASGTHVVGVALDRPANTSKTWIYFPEPQVPFYRVTYLSNYSPHITPRRDQTLLLTETSTSPYRREDPDTIVERVVEGLRRARLIAPDEPILSTWWHHAVKSYPVPTLGRDQALATIEPWLEAHGLASRGRFGGWRYEIGNMDHSCMQGVEWVNRTLFGQPETVWTPVGARAT